MATTKKSKKSKKSAVPVSRASTTKTFLKSRVSKPTLGKWSSGFSACKKYAEDNDVPLIAVWSNGDACGHCTMFETAVMNSKFTKWMGTSKCVFWFGCSSDTSKDDKMNGTGYVWAWKNQSLSLYPFCRVYWKSGKVDKAESGDYWIDKKSTGYTAFIKKLESLLKKYFTATTTPTPPEALPETPVEAPTEPSSGSCENCSSTDGCSKEECDKLKEQVNTLTAKVEMLEARANSYLEQVQQKDVEIQETKKVMKSFLDNLQDSIARLEDDMGL